MRSRLLASSRKLVLRRHIYVADALQVVSALHVGAKALVTGDRALAREAREEGLGALELAPPG